MILFVNALELQTLNKVPHLFYKRSIFAFMRMLTLLCLLSLSLYGQRAGIPANLPEPKGYLWLMAYRDSVFISGKIQAGISEFERAMAVFEKQNKPTLEQACWTITRQIAISQAKNSEVVFDICTKAIAESHKRKWPAIEAEFQLRMGLQLFWENKKGPAFEQMLRAWAMMQKLDAKKYPWLSGNAIILGDCFFKLGDLQKAVSYSAAYESTDTSWMQVSQRHYFRNTVGLAYRQMNMYDSAAWYFERSYESARASKDSFWMSLSWGNLGAVYYAQKKYDKALFYLQYDYNESGRFKEFGSMSNAGVLLADCYRRAGKLAEAAEVVRTISPYMAQNPSVQTKRQWYTLLFYLARQDGKTADALRFADSVTVYNTLFVDNRDRETVQRVNNKLEVEEYISSIKLLSEQRRNALLTRNALMAGIVLIAIIAMLLLNRYRMQQKKRLAEAAQQQQLAEEKLKLVKLELDQFALRLKEKAALAEKFEAELLSLQNRNTGHQDETTEVLSQLLQSTILTEEEWQSFRQLFEKVHPGFMTRLRQKLPDLTPAETRLLVLTRLPLTQKEMSSTLGIGYESIRKTRHRLRKKLQLPEEGSLDDLIAII